MADDMPLRPTFTVVNPATGQKGKTWTGQTPAEAAALVAETAAVQREWRKTSFAHRAGLMKKAAEVLRRRRDELAALMTVEMGKLVVEARGEVEKCAFNCDYFADNAETFLAPMPVDLGGPKAYVTYNPLGVVFAVMPWNFPLWQVFRFAAPTLMAGNGAVLKHASNVPGCAMVIEEIFREAGFPEGLFRTLLIPSSTVAGLIADRNVAAVTLTGSVEAGRKVAEAAGRNLKKCVLELGGADAYLILDDADIELAASVAATARMVNGGQSCVAGKRFIVTPKVRAAFETALVEKMKAFTIGDPTQESSKLGPMNAVSARDEIHDQVERSVKAGAKLLLGGVVPDQAGAWYPATILTNVTPSTPVYEEEVFGPVASIIEARDEEDAIAIANGSVFGLGSGVVTKDVARGEAIAAERLDAGMSFVNAAVRSDPRLPFGGVKDSGYGREVSHFGILEFVNIKSVLVG